MDVAVGDCLSGDFPRIDPDVETFDRFVGSDDLGSNRIKEKADGPSLGLIKVEVSCDVSARDSQSVQRRHGEPVADSHRKLVLGDHPFTHVAEHTVRLFQPELLADGTEIGIVSRTLVGVALIAERLKVRPIIAAGMPPGNNVINFERPLISRNSA